MCETQKQDRTPSVDKLEANAKVFIEGKNRPLLVTETPEDIDLMATAAPRAGPCPPGAHRLGGRDQTAPVADPGAARRARR